MNVVVVATAFESARTPIALLALSALGGALTAGMIGLLGAWIQGRRDHQRWLRERRFESFTAAVSLLRRTTALFTAASGLAPGDPKFAQLMAQEQELKSRWPEISAPFHLLGPDAADQAVAKVAKAFLDNASPDEIKAAEAELITTMRDALNVKG